MARLTPRRTTGRRDGVTGPLDPSSYRVVEQPDGGFAVHIRADGRTKIVPGFPTEDQAQQWIDRALGRRRSD